MSSWLFRLMHSGAIRAKAIVPVAVLSEALQARLDSTTATVWLSAETAQKQIARRSLAAEDYAVVQRLLDTGTAVEEPGGSLAFYGSVEGKWWKAVVKPTKARDELYLVTLHRSNEKQVRKQLERRGKDAGE